MARSRDTMNRPDSSSLNAGAEPTVAAKAFEKAMKENSVTPAIATGFVPPVVKEDAPGAPSRPSPFRQVKTADSDQEESSEVKKPSTPAIATGFIPMPGYMKKQEINPFKSNKGPVKRPVSASVNHAAAAAAGEIDDDEAEKHKSTNEKPSFTAALAGQEVHSTFRPTEFKTQAKIDPFKRNTEPVERGDDPLEAEAEKKEAPLKRKSPFQIAKLEMESGIKQEESTAVQEVEPQVAPEPVIEPAPVQDVEPEPQKKEEYSPFKQVDDIDDFEPVEGFSPFKPLDGEVKPDDETPAPQTAKAEPAFFTSGNEDKGRGGILGGLFKRR